MTSHWTPGDVLVVCESTPGVKNNCPFRRGPGQERVPRRDIGYGGGEVPGGGSGPWTGQGLCVVSPTRFPFGSRSSTPAITERLHLHSTTLLELVYHRLGEGRTGGHDPRGGTEAATTGHRSRDPYLLCKVKVGLVLTPPFRKRKHPHNPP